MFRLHCHLVNKQNLILCKILCCFFVLICFVVIVYLFLKFFKISCNICRSVFSWLVLQRACEKKQQYEMKILHSCYSVITFQITPSSLSVIRQHVLINIFQAYIYLHFNVDDLKKSRTKVCMNECSYIWTKNLSLSYVARNLNIYEFVFTHLHVFLDVLRHKAVQQTIYENSV